MLGANLEMNQRHQGISVVISVVLKSVIINLSLELPAALLLQTVCCKMCAWATLRGENAQPVFIALLELTAVMFSSSGTVVVALPKQHCGASTFRQMSSLVLIF